MVKGKRNFSVGNNKIQRSKVQAYEKLSNSFRLLKILHLFRSNVVYSQLEIIFGKLKPAFAVWTAIANSFKFYEQMFIKTLTMEPSGLGNWKANRAWFSMHILITFDPDFAVRNYNKVCQLNLVNLDQQLFIIYSFVSVRLHVCTVSLQIVSVLQSENFFERHHKASKVLEARKTLPCNWNQETCLLLTQNFR